MQNRFLLVPKMERHDNPALNVLIVYENEAAGQRAMRILSKLADDHRGELTFQTQIWRFDVLEDPVWRKAADTDAMKADMLVISIESEADLPASVRRWLTAGQPQKPRGVKAVIALFGTEEEGDDANSPRLKFVKGAAEEAGLSFFAPLPHPQTNLRFNSGNLHSPLEIITRSNYDNDRGEGYRHWGINE